MTATWPRRSRPTPARSAPSATASPTAATRSAARRGRTLEIYERLDITGHVRAVAPRFKAHLDRLGAHPLVGEARACGLMGALELAPEKSPQGFAAVGKVGARMAAEMAERGVIARAIGDSLAFCPPMIITEDEIDEMFAPVEAALDATEAWARAEGHLG
jgi:4-aminobutyrate---pyruvate transaminase